MATVTSAIKFPVRQDQKRPKSDAERAKAYRARRKAEAAALPSAEHLIPPDHIEPALTTAALPAITSPATACDSTPVRRQPIASIVLIAAAFGLAAVGIGMNGYYARTMGATDTAAALFLIVGIASDVAALVLPAVAARAWQAGHRGAALVGWLIFLVTFCFAVTNAIGFTALNVADVTASRAATVTPAVMAAQVSLDDAKAARSRECATGTGKVCRAREETVVSRQATLDQAMAAVQATADPQTEAATRLVTWVLAGTVRPSEVDFNMLRLLLLALLPQVGGLLVLVARAI